MVWYMVWYGMVWYRMVGYGMLWNGMVWYGMVWYGMVWYDRYGIVGMVIGCVIQTNEDDCSHKVRNFAHNKSIRDLQYNLKNSSFNLIQISL